VRGYQRKVIFLKDTGSRLFDEAYFVISRKGEEARVEQSDMIFEANRIIRESLEEKEHRLRKEIKGRSLWLVISFFLGVLISLIITAVIYFVFLK
jgi:hypothetical protein